MAALAGVTASGSVNLGIPEFVTDCALTENSEHCQDYGFRRFLSRGKTNVLTEFLLLAFAYNINKLHAKIQANRTGVQLHTKMTA